MTYDSTQAAGSPADHSIAAQVAETGQQRITALIDLQREFHEAFEELNRDLLARAQAEASLACELVRKLGSTNPAAAYQDWINRHGEMLTQDALRLITGGERMRAPPLASSSTAPRAARRRQAPDRCRAGGREV